MQVRAAEPIVGASRLSERVDPGTTGYADPVRPFDLMSFAACQ